jgi:type II secretory pathway component PulK
MNRIRNRQRAHAGVALLTALGLLFVFSLLGLAYVGYMSTVVDQSNYALRSVRACHIARAGVYAAIGEIQVALEDPAALAKALSTAYELEFPIYTLEQGAPEGFAANAMRNGVARVSIRDESGKINLNHAPPRVLQAALGVDGDTARRIRSGLPIQEAAPAGPGQSWMASLDDLVTRGFLTPAAFRVLPKHLLTVYSVADHANPVGFLNVNAAPPEVLAAILDIPPDAAQALAAKRANQPFRDLQELAAAAGKDPATFNFRPAPDTPSAPPKELGFQSRCFRIVSQATVSDLGPNGQEIHPTRKRVEAVVILSEDGTPQVTFWSEAPEQGEIGKV